MSSIPVVPEPQHHHVQLDQAPTAPSSILVNEHSIDGLPSSSPSLKRGRSDVWDTFLNLKAEGKAVCTRCNKVMSYHPNSGTSALRRHIRTACGRYYDSAQPKPIPTLHHTSPLASSSFHPNSFNPERAQDDLIRLSLSRPSYIDLVNEPFFQALVKSLQPNFSLLERSELQEKCLTEFHRMKHNLHVRLAAGSFRVSLTSDCWTTKQGLNYIFVAAYWIESNWILQRKLLAFKLVPSSFSQANLASLLHQTVTEWCLQDRIVSFTIDNTFHRNNTPSQARLLLGYHELVESVGQDIIPTRVGSHVFTAAIKDGLSDADPALDKLRSALRYVRSSAPSQQAMNEVLENLKLEPLHKGLILDVPDDWTSTYLMIENALSLERVFACMEIYDAALPKIANVDWQVLRSICKFLKLLYEVTINAFGPKNLTSNTAFQHLWKVSNHLDHGASSDDPVIREVASKINEHFKLYWEKLSPTLGILAILDPRLKTHFIKFCLGRGTSLDSATRPSLSKIERKLQDTFEAHYRTERPRTSTLNKSEPYDMELHDAEEMLEFERSLVASIEEKYETDLARYLAQAPEVGQSRDSNFDVLYWWKTHQTGYPDLALMARDLLSSQICSVVSEDTFRAAAEIVDNSPDELSDSMLESMVLSQDWIRHP